MAMIDQHDKQEELEMAKRAAVANETFPELVKAATEFANLSDELDTAEAKVSDMKARREHLRKMVLPDLMRKAGLVDTKNKGSFTIPGAKIYLETRVNASVTEANKAKVFKWLKDNKLGDMIKETVHHQTLTAFVRSLREAGKEIPPTVSVFEETVAKMKKA
jgi:hypothetical protein